MNTVFQDIHDSYWNSIYNLHLHFYLFNNSSAAKAYSRKQKRLYLKPLGFRFVNASKADYINLQDVFVGFVQNCSEKDKPAAWKESSCLTFENS